MLQAEASIVIRSRISIVAEVDCSFVGLKGDLIDLGWGALFCRVNRRLDGRDGYDGRPATV